MSGREIYYSEKYYDEENEYRKESPQPPSSANAPGGLTDEQIGAALSTLVVLGEVEGGPHAGRAALETAGLIPHDRPLPSQGEIEDDAEMTDAPLDTEELSDYARENESGQREDRFDWADESEAPLSLDDAPVDELSNLIDNCIKQEGNASEEPPSVSPYRIRESPDQLKEMFRKLYDGLSTGINSVLQSVMTIQTNQASIMSDIRLLKDGQASISASIKSLQSDHITLSNLQGGVQSELLAIREEFSVCTVAFEKITSGINHLASTQPPIGKLPSLTSYKSSAIVGADPLSTPGLTALPISPEKMEEILIKANFPAPKIEGIIGLLNNRTAKYYSAHLPSVFPGISLSHPAVERLLGMGALVQKEQILSMIKLMQALLNATSRPVPEQPSVSPRPVSIPAVQQAHPLTAAGMRIETGLDF